MEGQLNSHPVVCHIVLVGLKVHSAGIDGVVCRGWTGFGAHRANETLLLLVGCCAGKKLGDMPKSREGDDMVTEIHCCGVPEAFTSLTWVWRMYASQWPEAGYMSLRSQDPSFARRAHSLSPSETSDAIPS